MSHAHIFTIHTSPSRQGGKMQDTIKELVAKSLMQIEALCAAFIKQNPDLPITDIQLCQKTEGTTITWWVEPRAEDRMLVSENKSLKREMTELHDAIKRGEKILLGGKWYRFEECEGDE